MASHAKLMSPYSNVTTPAHAMPTPVVEAVTFVTPTPLVRVTACRPMSAGLQMLVTLMLIACSVAFASQLAMGRFVPRKMRICATLYCSGISVRVVCC